MQRPPTTTAKKKKKPKSLVDTLSKNELKLYLRQTAARVKRLEKQLEDGAATRKDLSGEFEGAGDESESPSPGANFKGASTYGTGKPGAHDRRGDYKKSGRAGAFGGSKESGADRKELREREERNRRLQATEKFKPRTAFIGNDKSGIAVYKFVRDFKADYLAHHYDVKFMWQALVKCLLLDPVGRVAAEEATEAGADTWDDVCKILLSLHGSSNALEVQEAVLASIRMGVDDSVRKHYSIVKGEVAIYNDIAAVSGVPLKTDRDVKRFFTKGLLAKGGNTHQGLKAEVSKSCDGSSALAAVLARAVHLEEVEENYNREIVVEETSTAAAAQLSRSTKPVSEEITSSKSTRVTFESGGEDALAARSKPKGAHKRKRSEAADDNDSDSSDGEADADVAAPAMARYKGGKSANPHAGGNSQRPKGECFQFARNGSCSYGAACRFAHANASAVQGLAAPAPTANAFAQEACRNFQRGACARGSACRYAHAQGAQTPQTPPRPLPPIHHPFTGSNATQQRRAPTSPFAQALAQPCRDFARGQCARSNCRFLH
jgi:hypothetical protein